MCSKGVREECGAFVQFLWDSGMGAAGGVSCIGKRGLGASSGVQCIAIWEDNASMGSPESFAHPSSEGLGGRSRERPSMLLEGPD